MIDSLQGIERILQLPTVHASINTLWRELPPAVNEEGRGTPEELLFLTIRNFLSSIYCEGFEGAFFNAYLGGYENEVIEAYQGMLDCKIEERASLVAEAMAIIGNGISYEEFYKSLEDWPGLSDEQEKKLHDLNNRFFELNENFEDILYAWINKNKEQFTSLQ